MSVIPGKVKLTLYEGSTFDQTFRFKDPDLNPLDFTGWAAQAQVRKDFDSPASLSLTSGVTVSVTQSGIEIDGPTGTVRLYITDEDMRDLEVSDFTEVKDDQDRVVGYTGVWDLELQNPAGERFRYLMGAVAFSREVTQTDS